MEVSAHCPAGDKDQEEVSEEQSVALLGVLNPW